MGDFVAVRGDEFEEILGCDVGRDAENAEYRAVIEGLTDEVFGSW